MKTYIFAVAILMTLSLQSNASELLDSNYHAIRVLEHLILGIPSVPKKSNASSTEALNHLSEIPLDKMTDAPEHQLDKAQDVSPTEHNIVNALHSQSVE